MNTNTFYGRVQKFEKKKYNETALIIKWCVIEIGWKNLIYFQQQQKKIEFSFDLNIFLVLSVIAVIVMMMKNRFSQFGKNHLSHMEWILQLMST